MSSYRFWRLLTKRRSLQRIPLVIDYGHSQKFRLRQFWGIWLFFFNVICMYSVARGLWQFVFILPLAILLCGTLFGAGYAMNISALITSQHDKRRYDLISVSPIGYEGLHWIACTRSYRRHEKLRNFNAILRGLTLFVGGMTLISPLLTGVMSLFFDSMAFDFGDVQSQAFSIVFLMSIFYLDIVQSILIGCVVGMLIPSYMKDRIAVQGISVMGFLLIQILFYLVCYLVIALFSVETIWMNSVGLFVGLIVFYVVREAIINGLLYILAYQLNSQFAALKTAFAMYA